MSERITIKALDRTAVFCQVGDCGKPALYLISETKPGFSQTRIAKFTLARSQADSN
jgi:hypothetical protein